MAVVPNAIRHGGQEPPSPSPREEQLRVLLVEDDDGDALLVEEMLLDVAESAESVTLERVSTVAAALPRVRRADCVLLDLQLPDAAGLDGLERILAQAPTTAVVVLTGRKDDKAGIAAVGAGAQDYLAKDQVDGQLLLRALRYAWERSRAEQFEQRLLKHQWLMRENSRLERGLLPSPLIEDARLGLTVRYRPGRDGTLLGGDFYDAIELPDASVRLIIGDVSGHGPDEAALGVALRIAWRSVVLAGMPMPEVLNVVEKLLLVEAIQPLFATVCALTVAPDRRSLRMTLAGHPPPLLLDSPGWPRLLDDNLGPPLGVTPGIARQESQVPLGPRWSLLLYTDGIFEGRTPDGRRHTGPERLHDTAARLLPEGRDRDETLDRLIRAMDDLHGGPLDDDIALALLTCDPTGETR